MPLGIAAIMLMTGIFGLLVGVVVVLIGLFLKSIRKALVTVGSTILLLCATVSGIGYYNAAINMQNLPVGTLIEQSPSPTGAYTLKIYLVEGGVTVEEPAIRGEIQYNQTGKKNKNIYWYYGQGSATIVWLNNETVSINGHALNVLNGRYRHP